MVRQINNSIYFITYVYKLKRTGQKPTLKNTQPFGKTINFVLLPSITNHDNEAMVTTLPS